MDLNHVDSGQWKAVVITVINLKVPCNAGKFLRSFTTGGLCSMELVNARNSKDEGKPQIYTRRLESSISIQPIIHLRVTQARIYTATTLHKLVIHCSSAPLCERYSTANGLTQAGTVQSSETKFKL